MQIWSWIPLPQLFTEHFALRIERNPSPPHTHTQRHPRQGLPGLACPGVFQGPPGTPLSSALFCSSLMGLSRDWPDGLGVGLSPGESLDFPGSQARPTSSCCAFSSADFPVTVSAAV